MQTELGDAWLLASLHVRKKRRGVKGLSQGGNEDVGIFFMRAERIFMYKHMVL